jgi:hypothetical protein
VLIALPVIAVLFSLAYFLARSSGQRLASLLAGTFGAVAALYVLVTRPDVPIEEQRDYAPVAMAASAALGVALSVLVRRLFIARHQS